MLFIPQARSANRLYSLIPNANVPVKDVYLGMQTLVQKHSPRQRNVPVRATTFSKGYRMCALYQAFHGYAGSRNAYYPVSCVNSADGPRLHFIPLGIPLEAGEE